MTSMRLSLFMRHGRLWMSDPWYRRSWFVGPHAAAILTIALLFAQEQAPEPPVAVDWAHRSQSEEQAQPLVKLRDRARTDPAAAAELDRQADAGSSNALLLSGTLTDPNLHPNEATPDRTAKTLARYRQAAEKGNAAAAYNLGNLLADGKYIPRDYVEARKMYERVASTFSPAQRQLGVFFLNGWGGTADLKVGMQLIRSASDRGDAISQVILGEALDRGLYGLQSNATEAVVWLEKAAIQGNAIAQREFAVHLLQGNGTPADAKGADYWLRQAAEHGDPVARSRLANGH